MSACPYHKKSWTDKLRFLSYTTGCQLLWLRLLRKRRKLIRSRNGDKSYTGILRTVIFFCMELNVYAKPPPASRLAAISKVQLDSRGFIHML